MGMACFLLPALSRQEKRLKIPKVFHKKRHRPSYDRDNAFFRDMFCFIKLFLQGQNVSRKYIRTFSEFHH